MPQEDADGRGGVEAVAEVDLGGCCGTAAEGERESPKRRGGLGRKGCEEEEQRRSRQGSAPELQRRLLRVSTFHADDDANIYVLNIRVEFITEYIIGSVVIVRGVTPNLEYTLIDFVWLLYVIETASREAASLVEQWFVGCSISHVVIERTSIQRYLGYSSNLITVAKRLAGWKSQNLSLVRRVTLAKSVIQSLPIYTMLYIDIPKGVIEEIQKNAKVLMLESDLVKARIGDLYDGGDGSLACGSLVSTVFLAVGPDSVSGGWSSCASI
ncbi:hypothetical protein HKD37_12G034150 [Glycine soja]